MGDGRWDFAAHSGVVSVRHPSVVGTHFYIAH